MKRSKTLLAVALLLALFIFIPAFPTSFFFSVSASMYGADDVHESVGLSENDVVEILDLVSGHWSFGSDHRYPRRLSLKQYFFDFENVGFQGIGLMPLGFADGCPDCSAAAFSSVTRNTLDVASTMYFLAKDEGVWQIREVRDGVTGTPVYEGQELATERHVLAVSTHAPEANLFDCFSRHSGLSIDDKLVGC